MPTLPLLKSTGVGDDTQFVVTMASSATASSDASASTLMSAEMSSSATASSTMAVSQLYDLSIESVAAASSNLDGTSTTYTETIASTAVASSSGSDQSFGARTEVVNSRGGLSRYTGYAFNSYAEIGGELYGANAEGLFKLGGDTDEDREILAMVGIPASKYGSNAIKGVGAVFLSVQADAPLTVGVAMDNGTEYLYKCLSGEGTGVQRANPGRGLRGTYISLNVYNPDGDDFVLTSAKPSVENRVTSRVTTR